MIAAVLCVAATVATGACMKGTGSQSLAGCDGVSVAEIARWSSSPDVLAERGSEELTTRGDPAHPSCLYLTAPRSCWLLDLEARSVWYPSCGLIDGAGAPTTVGSETPATVSLGEAVPGKAWFDVQADCGKSLGALFESPRFDPDRVVFQDCGHAIVVHLSGNSRGG